MLRQQHLCLYLPHPYLPPPPPPTLPLLFSATVSTYTEAVGTGLQQKSSVTYQLESPALCDIVSWML